MASGCRRNMLTRRESRRSTKGKGAKERAKEKGYASAAGRLDICGGIALKKKDSRKVLERQAHLGAERGKAGLQKRHKSGQGVLRVRINRSLGWVLPKGQTGAGCPIYDRHPTRRSSEPASSDDRACQIPIRVSQTTCSVSSNWSKERCCKKFEPICSAGRLKQCWNRQL